MKKKTAESVYPARESPEVGDNMKAVIRRAVYEKFIVPTKVQRPDYIGVEIEMPVVNLSGEAVDEQIAIQTAEAFSAHFGFAPEHRDAEGSFISAKHSETGDILSFDCSYSNLELSFGKAAGLFEIKERFEKYIRFLNAEFAKHDYILTGMGVNPAANINHNQPIKNERYRMLYHYLHSYPQHTNEVAMRFHERPDFGTFTSASQVQLDVRCDELVDYIGTQSIYCTMRDGKYVDFTPVTVNEYFSRDSITGEYFDGERYQTIEFAPQQSDLDHLRTFKFEDLTFRGTIEYRSACCQPLSEALTVAAFHTGLKEKLPELKELLEQDTVIYTHGFSAAELQKLFSKRDLPAFPDEKAIEKQLLRILDLAADGLRKRGRGGGIFARTAVPACGFAHQSG